MTGLPPVFVAALFAILDSHVGWLDAINGHAFVAIGNLAGIPQESGAAKARALVVVIDQAAAESRYLDRSPLDRCQLLADLGAVYSAMDRRNQQRDAVRAKSPTSSAQRLDLLVVDLDLSPAPWLATDEGKKTAEAQCERDLHRMIAQAHSQWRIRTVLMNPFESVDTGVMASKATWKKDMEGSAVTFGRAVLPVEYGLVIKQYCAPDAMAVTAYDLWTQRKRANNEAHETNECIETSRDATRNHKGASQHIDPRRYLSGVVPVAASAQPGFSGQLDRALGTDPSANTAADGADFQAVFFGAAYGEGDTFVTPLGELYGVEIHAASFLSFLDPLSADNLLAELLADIVFGFVFGFVIAFFWEQYFRLRLSDDSDRRLIAPVVLGGLGVCRGARRVCPDHRLVAAARPLRHLVVTHSDGDRHADRKLRVRLGGPGDSRSRQPQGWRPTLAADFPGERQEVLRRVYSQFVAEGETTVGGAADVAAGSVGDRGRGGVLALGAEAGMKRLFVLVAWVVSSWSWSPSADAQNCRGLLDIPATASSALTAFIKSLSDTNAACGSVKVVLSRVVSREKTGGRKLEPDKPLDVRKAQANLDAALRDPEIKARVDRARVEIKDENVLLAYEAAVFDEEGYYDARDLKIQQLQQRLN